ncbi:TPA: sigma-70 family RNA polymerase sigma factor, partial [Streptococcus agalactiae]|nr:sigma-70 family RNA polymerase sigma factor [Streptococcus agalactiae]
MRDFEELFDKVKPIVMKLRRNYFVQLWEYDDWIQEGRIVLFRLLEEHPYLL